MLVSLPLKHPKPSYSAYEIYQNTKIYFTAKQTSLHHCIVCRPVILRILNGLTFNMEFMSLNTKDFLIFLRVQSKSENIFKMVFQQRKKSSFNGKTIELFISFVFKHVWFIFNLR